ncbi:MAG: YhcH/YjgK/YiaL family protein [Clostridia bacterium]|nr:YhcH/YjgK/YiaL family protein [Clostridia bacterium]
MIIGNIKTYKSCGMTTADLDKYLDVLRNFAADTPNGTYQLDDGAFYNVVTPTLSSGEGREFESHKQYIDIQYIVEGTEQIEYADLQTLTVTKPYSEEGDCALETGKGVLLTLNAGDFAIFCPEDAHKPCCGEGTSRKVIVKVPVK